MADFIIRIAKSMIDKWARRKIRNTVIKRAGRCSKDGMGRRAKQAEARLLVDRAVAFEREKRELEKLERAKTTNG
jgi:hypothetical protein